MKTEYLADANPGRRGGYWLILVLVVTAGLAACTEGPVTRLPVADTVIIQAKVWTADPHNPWAEAVAIEGEKILAVGSEVEINGFIGDSTELIDAGGNLVLPGFIDSHVHFLIGGMGLSSVQLRDAKTPQEFSQRIGEFATSVPEGQWILNGEWDHENWGGELPSREWIDEA